MDIQLCRQWSVTKLSYLSILLRMPYGLSFCNLEGKAVWSMCIRITVNCLQGMPLGLTTNKTLSEKKSAKCPGVQKRHKGYSKTSKGRDLEISSKRVLKNSWNQNWQQSFYGAWNKMLKRLMKVNLDVVCLLAELSTWTDLRQPWRRYLETFSGESFVKPEESWKACGSHCKSDRRAVQLWHIL